MKISPLTGKWTGLSYPTEISNPITGVNRETLKKIGIVSVSAPNVNIHSRLMKHHVQSRLSKIESGKNLDWASAEALAVGSLLLEGYSARISGQDVGRGTFSQRHFQLVDQETEQIVVPLNGISNQQGHLEVANSSLSEMAVLGFEYGMSLENPKCLNIWEAQFGDFFNGAQVIIDAYLCSGEQKWLKQSGLVMLLPHGYDGAGPEHSSCRIERFLQLSDEPMDIIKSESKNPNWHVINPTTPAQYFHALRRQMKRNYRKPLIVVAPKTLLKSSAAVSDISEMSDETRFKAVLTENRGNSINKVVFVSGKLYYDLVKGRAERGLEENVHFIRIEELCPFPAKEIQEAVKDFKNVEYVWCQEEPENMGAYSFMLPRLTRLLNVPLRYVGREAAAAPATGIGKRHKKEQAAIIENCFK
jgi:probable 2-oxoglutarate dehydrogenase E1 component DHKTD1